VSSQDGAFDRCRDYTDGAGLLHMAYTLRPSRESFDACSVRALAAEAAKSRGWLCWSFSNHDVVRALSRWSAPPGAPPDPRFARLLMTFQLCLRGSVLIYQGEELGLTEAELSFDQLRDPFGIALWPEFRGRDGSRTPMPWEREAAHGGFSTGAPWLPMPRAHLDLAVDVQERDEGGLLHEWRRFLAYRRAHPALVQGELTVLDVPAPVIGFLRHDADERVTCLFNLSAGPVEVAGPGVLPGYGTFVEAKAS
jgi:alpha-glucosidase